MRGTTGQVTSLSESSQVEVGDNREKWGDFWEKLIAINQNILSRLCNEVSSVNEVHTTKHLHTPRLSIKITLV
jgi:hypothetical protein